MAQLEASPQRSGAVHANRSPRPRKLWLLRRMPARWMLAEGDAGRRALHLTFDDGPHPEHTPRLLDLLARYRARATFFLIGERAEQNPDIVHRLLREGHMLGNHSWQHPDFDRISRRRQREEIARTDRLLQAFDGRQQHDFRPPRGALPAGMVLDCVRRGRRIAFWSYDSFDYSRRPVDELVAIARRHPVRPGEVVLMHDDSAHSLELLRVMLPEWIAAGYALEPLPCAVADADPAANVEDTA